ncbi:hypothetical protein FRX31_014858 [Thalictrum thalictroides]|uniref:Uncharacterized protein n=1 Tax=Thalictrum thalictroides TaxID=46969 RepID=A0A7J6WGL3_THATH|nr:hypothetical protein FRX31_014858 [Thalictrum thalictroides]
MGSFLCEPHFARFRSFSDEVKEFCTLVFEAEPIVEIAVNAFFLERPHRITQEILQSFKVWVKSDMGEPVRSIYKPWYQYIRKAHLDCEHCRGKVASVVDSGSEIEKDESDVDEN